MLFLYALGIEKKRRKLLLRKKNEKISARERRRGGFQVIIRGMGGRKRLRQKRYWGN
jgi:hypothetical protein